MTRFPRLPHDVRRAAVVLAHLGLWTIGFGGAFLLRFDGSVPERFFAPALIGLACLLTIRSGVFWISGLFHGILSFSGLPDVKTVVRATTLSSVLFIGLGVAVHPLTQPRSIYAGEWLLSLLGSLTLRVVARSLRERRRGTSPVSTARRALLIGAGGAGEMLLRDLEQSARPEITICGILDDDPAKHGAVLRGVRVVGGVDEVTLRRAIAIHDAQLVVLAVPSAPGHRVREIVAACRAAGIETKTLPSLQQIVNGDVRLGMLRDVAIEDLLRRDPIQLDEASLGSFLRGKVVLVTGAAGSIGSELCRQGARYAPHKLLLVDHNENGLFELEREIREGCPSLALEVLVADIKDVRRVQQILQQHSPSVVLHAAAHKHVPLMEGSPAEAIKNNVIGTKVVADISRALRVETFVLISTDKAVNPSSVMGASKRVAEMYIQSLSQQSHTRFVAVRFGNVLGSAGSVVPVFRRQIASGGPVTVTHPEMRRYFMTIPEAAQLVLQAGALARGGEIFVLDMGEPVKIVDLARDMIRMSGLRAETDIPIVFTGTRPGEKLFEELMHVAEGYDRTVHPKILVGRIAPVSQERMRAAIEGLADAIDGSANDVRRAFMAVVPEARFEQLPVATPELAASLANLRELETLVDPGVTTP